MPSVTMYFLTFLFGVNTPDALVVKVYGMLAVIAIYAILVRRKWNAWHAAGMALLMTLGGSMLPLLMNGAVWYQAQTLAFMLTALSVMLMMAVGIIVALVLEQAAVRITAAVKKGGEKKT